jgi:serine/threonine protein kinase
MAVRLETNAEPLPGYRLLERLGGGGFGEVWKCEAPGGLHKAIKFVYGDLQNDSQNGQQAEQELKALARVLKVRHAYILSLERFDVIDGQLLIVTELADRNLWDRFKECRAQGLPGIPRDELLAYLEESAEALDLMNGEYDLQHLDIKPQNLFLVRNHIKVADFGLVKDLSGLETKITGGITPVYAAPETFDGIVSRFCDQYSLAICYQELLTGQRPFSGANVRQLVLQHIQGHPNVTTLPINDRPIVLRSLSKVPNERFPTCREMIRLLRQGSGSVDPLSVTPAPTGRPVLEGGTPATQTDSSLLTPGPTALLGRITDSSQGPVRALRNTVSTSGSSSGSSSSSGELPVVRPEAEAPMRLAPPEVTGDGSLFPALVIGLGQHGMGILRRLRERVVESFGGMDAVPNLKFLLLDTDPEITRPATQGKASAALSNGEVFIAPLSRPSHYLKPRDGRPNLATWIDQKMLYRIPRTQVTTGVRALGRLAFCDNYRPIMRRLQSELESILDPAALQHAGRQTKLGQRTNRPRVYVLTSLTGGTGGGMFLDLAYSLRALLRQYGYDQPDIVSVLLVPGTERVRPGSMALGNAFAALTELRYHSTPGTLFTALYHEREAAISDPEPPFSRTLLLRLPEETDEVGTRELHDMAGQHLFRDLCSPLGRTADLARAGLASPPWSERGRYFQTFGLFRLSWPRRELLQEVGRQLCLRMLARWMSKDSKPVSEAVATYIREQWRQQDLAPDKFITELQERLQKVLTRDPEGMLMSLVEPLAQQIQEEGLAVTPRKKRWGQNVEQFCEVAPADLRPVMEELVRLIGRPDVDAIYEPDGEMGTQIRQIGEALTAQWSQALAEVTVHLLEEPEFRLAGAEEAVRQVFALLERILQRYEPLIQEVNERVETSYQALRKALGGKSRELNLTADEMAEVLKAYPRARFQSLLLKQVSQALLALRGHQSEQLREINFCRVRLAELQRAFENSALPAGGAAPSRLSAQGPGQRPEAGRVLLPAGCRLLEEAIDQMMDSIGPDQEIELDHIMEAMIQQHFQAMVNVCMTQTNILKEVQMRMLDTASDYAGSLLAETNVAEMFLDQVHEYEQRLAELSGYFVEAQPELRPGLFSNRNGRRSVPMEAEVPVRELIVLAYPPGPAGEEVFQLAREAMDTSEVEGTGSTEDVIFYREVVNLPLATMDPLGEAGRDAYCQMLASEHFTPHSRTDVAYSVILDLES